MAAYISLDDVKPRLVGYGQVVRDPSDPAIGTVDGVDADGWPVRYTDAVNSIIAGTIAAIDNCLRTEFDGKDGQKRLFWQDPGFWDLDIPRARAISTVEYRETTGDVELAKAENWETLPGYDSYDIDGIVRLRRLGDEEWKCGEYWITGDWGYAPQEVPADIKDGAIDQVHYRFSMLPGLQHASVNVYDGGETQSYGGLLWSGQMYGTLMHHLSMRGMV